MTVTDLTRTPTRPDSQLVWRRLLQVSRMLLHTLDHQLGEQHQLAAIELDVLMTLEDAVGRLLRMSELAEAVMLSAGGITRLIDRLEYRGLVRRIKDPSDARVLHATLTDAGSARVTEARATHHAVINEFFGSKLTRAELNSLSRTVRPLIDR